MNKKAVEALRESELKRIKLVRESYASENNAGNIEANVAQRKGGIMRSMDDRPQKKAPQRNFFARFVEGYLESGTEGEGDNRSERLSITISNFFGNQRQGGLRKMAS